MARRNDILSSLETYTMKNRRLQLNTPLTDDKYEELKEKYSGLGELISLGKDRGYLLYDDVINTLPEEVNSSKDLDIIFQLFSHAEIEVVDHEQQADVIKPISSPKPQGDEEEHDLAPGFDKTNDPVRMYLREMGKVPLLTREEEVVIAKRIEQAHQMVITALSRSPVVISEILCFRDQLKKNELDIKNLVEFQEEELTAASVKEEDFVEQMLVANTHTTLLCFSNLGQVHWLKVYEIPTAGRVAKGRPLVNLIQLSDKERITSMVPIEAYDEDHFIFMSTKMGTVKKTSLMEFSNQRKGGKRAITLAKGDELVGTEVTDGKEYVMLVSNAGKAAHFSESEVRSMGRTAQGVRGN